jgi:hypothetical protein
MTNVALQFDGFILRDAALLFVMAGHDPAIHVFAATEK